MPEYCVTGGSGFIASYIVKALLDKGHTVRTTVRDPEDGEKVGFLWELRGAKERLKMLKADLREEGSFDEAVQGVDGVFHTAAPVIVNHHDDKTLIDPTVNGAVNVLKSCERANVRRVVMTSSCSAIRYRDDAQQVSPLNESHWSDLEYCKRHNLWYAYAKTLAEREAWKVAGESGIDLVVVNPSFVIGPLLAPQPSSTLLILLSTITGRRGEYPNQAIGFVHIDDVVSAHLIAMQEPKASGRLVCSGPVAHWSNIIHMLRATYPSYPYEQTCSNQEGDNIPHGMDTTKIAALGLTTFKSLQDMFTDCINSFQHKGFL
ncbi:tetraketide alpha-pyrone reductase 2-like isoform X2 [Neltuma alba]|uniref:tetraketide alpha-pyrone reductase 2-like isoform X2 n=1 Tax=Neltuma alba TaxID=207710 RepID=UPI0010A336A0|nr:tetraketide alpha-pyrone reductase 2-like isoform X2 [Prosopis alba]